MVRPIDALPERGKLALVPHFELHMGGLAAVTATVFSQLGGEAAFIGAVGADGFGDHIINSLTWQQVNIDRVRRTADFNTSATVALISDDGERTFLHHVGANGTVSEDDVDAEILHETSILHWGGPGVTPGLDGEPIGRVMERARAAGVTTSMDTCYDGSGLWFPRIEYALPHLDIAMMSIEEARLYTGKDTPEAISAFLRSFGVETVMIKLGGDGVFVQNSAAAHRIPAHKVEVVDSTGAGDAACGGFLYGHGQGWDLETCGRLANAVGGLTVQVFGGAEGVNSLDETLAFMDGA